MLQASADRAEYDQAGRAWLAYHVGVMMRAEKPPTFEELLGQERKPVTQEELSHKLRLWEAALNRQFGSEGRG